MLQYDKNTKLLRAIQTDDNFLIDDENGKKVYTVSTVTIKFNYIEDEKSYPFFVLLTVKIFDIINNTTIFDVFTLEKFSELYNEYFGKTESC